MVYEELVSKLRSECTLPYATLQLMREAANAIEELQAQLMYSNDAAKAIAEKVPKWISVNDQLPREDEDILAFSDKQRIYVGRLTRYKYRTPEIEFLNKSEMWNNFYVGKGITITHWQPMLDFPKEE